MLPNNENLKISEVTWTKDCRKYSGHNSEPAHIFFSSSGRTGKSHLLSDIYYHNNNIEFFIVKKLTNFEFFNLKPKKHQQYI